jgi:N-methylhydantoinase A
VASLFAELSNLAAQRGVDMRDYTMLPFGGAGALLACLVADELGIARVAVPQSPRTLCALGALLADVAGGFVRSLLVPLAGSGKALRDVYGALEAQARGWLTAEHTATADYSIALSADMRYVGQSLEIDVPLLPAWIVAGDEVRVEAAFHDAHSRVYGHADPTMPAEIVDLRLTVIGTRPKPPL